MTPSVGTGPGAGEAVPGPSGSTRWYSRESRLDSVAAPGHLRRMYEQYCDVEARNLLSLVPRSGLRAIYAAARSEVQEDGVPSDSMALAVDYARRILPLPPFGVWVRAYLSNRIAFLDALGIASVPRRAEPVLVDVRPAGEGWIAELHLHCVNGEWRGFLSFRGDDGDWSRELRTTQIFRGETPEPLVARFREFSVSTLKAFLRSVGP